VIGVVAVRGRKSRGMWMLGSGVDNALSASGLQRYCENIRTLLLIP